MNTPVSALDPYRKTANTMATNWPLVLGFLAMAIPAIQVLSAETWSREEGSHGPLILFTGVWLLWRQLPSMRKLAVSGNGWIVGSILLLAICAYVFGQAFDFVTLDAAGLYGVMLAIFYSRFGHRAIFSNWFVFFYLLFAVPLPTIWIDALTSPLKQFVSLAATGVLEPFGIPLTHEGVVIYVAQYQLLVEDACSGLNSIVGLLAIGLFYVYLVRASSWLYALILASLIIPLAVIANVFRIILLILLTYFAGNEVAQGFMHFAAGMFVFLAEMLLVFLADSLLFPIFSRFKKLSKW